MPHRNDDSRRAPPEARHVLQREARVRDRGEGCYGFGKERLEQELADLKKTASKPAESSDKSSFKSMLTNCYKEITGLVEFVKNAEPADRATFMKKALEILNVGKDALKAIDPCIEVESNNE